MFSRLIMIIVPVLLFCLQCFAFDDEDSVVTDDSCSSLMNTHAAARIDNGDSIVYLYYNFSDSCPNYFYEIKPDEKKIMFTFVNTRPGLMVKDDTSRQINIGPVKTMSIREQIKDKNEGMLGLKAEYYYVTNMTLVFDPVIKSQEYLDIVEKDKTLSITLKWPKDKRERRKLYIMPHKKRPVLAAALVTVGVAGLACGGYFLWKFLDSEDDEDNSLDPLLPSHSGN